MKILRNLFLLCVLAQAIALPAQMYQSSSWVESECQVCGVKTFSEVESKGPFGISMPMGYSHAFENPSAKIQGKAFWVCQTCAKELQPKLDEASDAILEKAKAEKVAVRTKNYSEKKERVRKQKTEEIKRLQSEVESLGTP